MAFGSGEVRGAELLRGAGVLVIGLALWRCASAGGGGSALDGHLDAGRRAAAVELFRTDTALQGRERPLFRMGVLFATPSDSFYAPARADSLFRRLLELHPGTRYRAQARGFRSLLDSVAARAARLDALERKMEALKAIDTGQYPDTGAVR